MLAREQHRPTRGGAPIAKRIEVDIASQTLSAFDNGKLIYKLDCITGDSGHPTDRGTFHVFLKDQRHVSHKYHVKMYYALFFTQDGKAIHQYHGPGNFGLVRTLKEKLSDWFGSHGCVRLTEKDAAAMFAWTPLNTTVHIK
jgi:lipoprotein-anchoring transpeptidase ErfK/SrfK